MTAGAVAIEGHRHEADTIRGLLIAFVGASAALLAWAVFWLIGSITSREQVEISLSLVLAYALVHTGSPETWLAPDGLEAYRGVWRRAQRATR